MGAVIVPILPDFHDNEIRHIIAHSECRVAFFSKKKREVLDHENVQDLSCVMLTDDLVITSYSIHYTKLYDSGRTRCGR